MNNCKPYVSIGLPVYNGEQYLAQTLDSLLKQTFSQFELIISDNASTDGTERICRSYAARDARIAYYRQERNLGAAANFNRVFTLSSGRYFKWAAADDLCAPEFIEKCVNVLDQHADVVLCYPKTNNIDAEGALIGPFEHDLHLVSSTPYERFTQFLYRMQVPHPRCNPIAGLIRSDILSCTPLIGHYIHSDACLLAELSLYGKFFELPDRLFFRRYHSRSYSGVSDKKIDYKLSFFDPALQNKIVLTRWKRHWEYFRSVNRVPLVLREKLALNIFLTKMLIEKKGYHGEVRHALKNVLKKMLFGIQSSHRSSYGE